MRAETALGLPVKTIRWNTATVVHPETAKLLLEGQPQQRPVTQAHVEQLIGELKAGRWVQTNEALAFDEDGLLFDGQHRLWACFLSGVSLPVLCCFNEPRANFDRIGTTVRRRTFADQLIIGGDVTEVGSAAIVAGAARFVWAYDAGRNPTMASSFSDFNTDLQRRTLLAHPGIHSAAVTFRSRRGAGMPAAPLAGLACMIREADAEQAEIFLHQITTGIGLSSGDPALAFRESGKTRRVGERSQRVELSYRFVRAWNAFAERRSMARVYGSNAPNGAQVRVKGMDVFPEITGYRRQR